MWSKGLAVAGLAGLLDASSYAMPPSAPPSLGAASSFAVLGKAVDNRGGTTITGNLGGTIANPPTFIAGEVRNDLAPFARADATAAYDALSAGQCVPLPQGDVPPGIYCVSSLAGTITLAGKGVWIFRATTLTTAPGTTVRVVNGGWEGDVFWQVAGSATLGASTTFAGNLLAHDHIALGSGATLSGRAIALTGTVTLDSNKVSLCCDKGISIAPESPLSGGAAGKEYRATFIASGGKAPYTYRITTSIPGLAPIIGNTLAFTPTATGTVTVTVTATDALGCPATNIYTITITIDCSTIVVLPSATPPTPDTAYDLPRGAAGQPYSQTFTTGGSTTCSVTKGALPPGLKLPNCTLSGTPTRPGKFEFTVTASDGTCIAHQDYSIVVCGVELPRALPDGCVGVQYGVTVDGAVFSGDFPPGVIPTGNTLAGKPTQAGCFNVTVTITDINGCTASRTYRICICPPLTLAPPPPLRPPCFGVPYVAKITATGGVPPYRFTPLAIPPFTLDANGTITGTPTVAGSINFIVTVTDSSGAFVSAPYTIIVPEAVEVLPATLPPVVPGYSQTIGGSGGTPGYTLTHTTPVPFGLSFDDKTGVLSFAPGIGPLMAPTATFTVTAVDANGCIGSRTYTLSRPCPTVALAPPSLPAGNAGTPYAQMLTATGGVAPYTITVISGSLPPGLTLASDGTIDGTPLVTGTYCFTVIAADAGGCGTGQVAYTITINAATCPAGTTITLSPPALPFAPTGVPYAQAITAAGGTAPYTFAVTAGTLPPGLTLGPITGLLAGTPTSGGHYAFTITATDANGCVGSMGCSAVMSVDIPTLSQWGIVLLALVLSILSMVALRR